MAAVSTVSNYSGRSFGLIDLDITPVSRHHMFTSPSANIYSDISSLSRINIWHASELGSVMYVFMSRP